MSDMGLGDDTWLQALKARGINPLTLNGSAVGPPQGIDGVFNGVVKGMGPQPPQGAPAGNPALLDAMQSFRPPHEALTGRPPGGRGLLDTLNPVAGYRRLQQDVGPMLDRLNTWANGQQAPASPQPSPVPPSGMGMVGGVPPVQSPPQLPQGNVQPTALNEPAKPSFGPTGPIPYFAAPPQQAANVPPPQAAPSQPQQMPAIPPASPVGRTQAAQGQGTPLDQYFQQMMALQRQRMLLGMAGGLLGAPSFGQGLGRAFTNASNTVAPESDLVTKIAQAQIAGQLERQKPYSTPADVQAAQLRAFSGEKLDLKPYKKGDRTFTQSASGREYDEGSGRSAWVFEHQGLDKPGGKRVPIEQAETRGNGRYILLDDGKMHDTQHPTFEGSERE